MSEVFELAPAKTTTTRDLAEFLSEPRVSAHQPKYIGFPFVIHAPLALLNRHPDYFHSMAKHGLIVCTRQRYLGSPTDVAMVRIAFRYGDSVTALKVFGMLSTLTGAMVFKNWL